MAGQRRSFEVLLQTNCLAKWQKRHRAWQESTPLARRWENRPERLHHLM